MRLRKWDFCFNGHNRHGVQGNNPEPNEVENSCLCVSFSVTDFSDFFFFFLLPGTSLVLQTVKNLPAMWETRVWSLGQEDPLEKAMAIHSSIFSFEIPRTEDPGGLQSMGSQRVGHDWETHFCFLIFSKENTHFIHNSISIAYVSWNLY